MTVRFVAACLAGLALATGCATVDTRFDADLPPAPTTIVSPQTGTSIVRADTNGAVLLGLPGAFKKPAVAISGGDVTISGFVSVDNNAAGNATLIIERLVGDTPAGMEIAANVDGTFSLSGVLGGRYRVFGYRVPDLITDVPAEFFVAAKSTKETQVKLRSVVEVVVDAAVAPELRVGQESRISVRVAIRQVVAGGVVQDVATPDLPLTLVPKPGIDATELLDKKTDATGSATWTITCSQDAAATVDVKVGPLPAQFGAAAATTTTLQLSPCRS